VTEQRMSEVLEDLRKVVEKLQERTRELELERVIRQIRHMAVNELCLGTVTVEMSCRAIVNALNRKEHRRIRP